MCFAVAAVAAGVELQDNVFVTMVVSVQYQVMSGSLYDAFYRVSAMYMFHAPCRASLSLASTMHQRLHALQAHALMPMARSALTRSVNVHVLHGTGIVENEGSTIPAYIRHNQFEKSTAPTGSHNSCLVDSHVALIQLVALQLTDSSAQIRSYVFDVVRATVPNINLDDVFEVRHKQQQQ